jgi:hypothetical protein
MIRPDFQANFNREMWNIDSPNKQGLHEVKTGTGLKNIIFENYPYIPNIFKNINTKRKHYQ